MELRETSSPRTTTLRDLVLCGLTLLAAPLWGAWIGLTLWQHRLGVLLLGALVGAPAMALGLVTRLRQRPRDVVVFTGARAGSATFVCGAVATALGTLAAHWASHLLDHPYGLGL